MRTVFVDVDTQIDFVFPAGALYAPGAETILQTVARLNERALEAGETLISTMDAHGEDDPEFRDWPAHCVVGTVGQRKPAALMAGRCAVLPSGELAALPDLRGQILLEKQHLDLFTNANVPHLLQALDAERYVVYGVVTEICVKYAAFGLLKTGRRVEVVTNAVRALKEADGQAMLEEFTRAGGYLAAA
jgi:nicotinamidase/pyrazinamidase